MYIYSYIEDLKMAQTSEGDVVMRRKFFFPLNDSKINLNNFSLLVDAKNSIPTNMVGL